MKIQGNEAQKKWPSQVIYMNAAGPTMRCREMKWVVDKRIYKRDVLRRFNCRFLLDFRWFKIKVESINEARSKEDGVVLVLIIGFFKVASSMLVHVATTAVEDVLGLATSLWHLTGSTGGCSFLYCQFGNRGAFIRPRIGLRAAFFDLIRAFFGEMETLRGRDFGVCGTSVKNWAGV